MLYHACSYTHFCRMPYVCCSQWDAYCCLPRVRDPATGALVSLGNFTSGAGGGPLPERVPAQQLRHLVSMWNMWYFWFMLIFLLFVCFGVCGAHKRRAAWAAAAAAAGYGRGGGVESGVTRPSATRRSLLLMDWAPRLAASGSSTSRPSQRLQRLQPPRFDSSPPPSRSSSAAAFEDDDEGNFRDALACRQHQQHQQQPQQPLPPPYTPRVKTENEAASSAAATSPLGAPPAYSSSSSSGGGGGGGNGSSQNQRAEPGLTTPPPSPPPPPYRFQSD